MATVKKLLNAGFSARQARALGIDSESIAAAGTNQATATLITKGSVSVSGADGTKGVILPTFDKSFTGEHFVRNATALILKVYPAVGESINAKTANQEVDIPGDSHAVFYEGVVSGNSTWLCFVADTVA